MVRQLANSIVASLRETPLALALVVINLIFLISFTLTLREISQAAERKDALFTELMQRNCK
jgi:hypothetical protein